MIFIKVLSFSLSSSPSPFLPNHYEVSSTALAHTSTVLCYFTTAWGNEAKRLWIEISEIMR